MMRSGIYHRFLKGQPKIREDLKILLDLRLFKVARLLERTEVAGFEFLILPGFE